VIEVNLYLDQGGYSRNVTFFLCMF